MKQDYDAELEVIKEVGGNLWLMGIGLAIGAIFLWGIGLLFNDHWSNSDTTFAVILVVVGPLLNRAPKVCSSEGILSRV